MLGSLRCRRLPQCPSVGAEAPPSSARPSARRLCRRRPAPRLLGWWGVFRLLTAPVRPPLVCSLPRCSLRWFCPPGATQSLRGCHCPVVTQLPFPLPGGTLLVFCHSGGLTAHRGTHGPLRRPCGPCCCPALPRCCRPYFTACLLVSPFAPASPHGRPAYPPRRRPRRGISRYYPCWPALPHVAALRRFPV